MPCCIALGWRICRAVSRGRWPAVMVVEEVTAAAAVVVVVELET